MRAMLIKGGAFSPPDTWSVTVDGCASYVVQDESYSVASAVADAIQSPRALGTDRGVRDRGALYGGGRVWATAAAAVGERNKAMTVEELIDRLRQLPGAAWSADVGLDGTGDVAEVVYESDSVRLVGGDDATVAVEDE